MNWQGWLCRRAVLEYTVESRYQEKDMTMSDKPLPDLKTFIENINKKDKVNGKKVRFDFVKRKRK